MAADFDHIAADHIFDGGELDCGSGLVLLIRENMLKVTEGGVLEMRSREPSVGVDLPPWCRLAGHAYLGKAAGPGFTRYFIRRGQTVQNDSAALAEDKKRAKAYEWRVRARSSGPLRSTVYCRNFSFEVGQPASFEERDANPSAVEYLLGALAGALINGFASECARENLEIDDIEITMSGRLKNILAHLGLEEGDPAFAGIELKCFASTLADAEKVRQAWERVVSRCPIAATLRQALELKIRFSVC